MIMKKFYVCAMCGYTFEECRPEEEAEVELKAEFGNVDKEDCDVVCDDCWEKVRPRNNPETFKAWQNDQKIINSINN